MEFKIKVKAKGTAQRIVRYTRDEEGNLQKHYHDLKHVKKISYKIKNKQTGDTIDKFKIKGLKRDTLKWEAAAPSKRRRRAVSSSPVPRRRDQARTIPLRPPHGPHLRH